MNASFTIEAGSATLLPGNPQQRILAIWFPYLPTERIHRQRFGRSWRTRSATVDRDRPPLVVSHRDRNAQRIATLDERAQALGLKPGTGIADARAIHPTIEVVEADPQADRQLLEALADWCDRYTPLVALDGADGLFLDITGCAHLFGGERAMLDDILVRFLLQGFDARAGLASTAGAAWAMARFRSASILPPGGEAGALAALPFAALRLEPATCDRLRSVGLRTIGSILAQPRAPFARRFGKSLVLRLDQALGRLEEAVSPRRPAPPLSVERHLAEPVVLIENIERLVLLLASTLKTDFERRGEGAKTLQLLLFRVDGAVRHIIVGASRPLRDPSLIGRLFHERLGALADEIDPGYGFDLVRLCAVAVAPFEGLQGDLQGAHTHGRDDDLALFVDRTRARLGETAVMRPLPAGSHIPERAAVLVPHGRELPVKPRRGAAGDGKERPIRLLAEPEPVEVMAAIPEGPPANFRWRRSLHRVAAAEGPERIAAEWWREKEPGPTRDYYRVEDEDGRRYWLYREGSYEASKPPPRWFMQGLFP